MLTFFLPVLHYLVQIAIPDSRHTEVQFKRLVKFQGMERKKLKLKMHTVKLRVQARFV